MVVDLLKEARYVRYMKNSKRWIGTDSQSAHGIMGSNQNTIYLLEGKSCPCQDKMEAVQVIQIDEAEYELLSTNLKMYSKENENLKKEITELKEQLNEQNKLLQLILQKL